MDFYSCPSAHSLLQIKKCCRHLTLQVAQYIEAKAPADGAAPLGLHPNAEIGVAVRQADALCAALLSLQPREAGGGGAPGVEDRARAAMDAVLEALPAPIGVEDARARAAEDAGPFVMVALQEAGRMNALLGEVRASLAELALGLKGDLTMSERMEELMRALAGESSVEHSGEGGLLAVMTPLPGCTVAEL